MDIITETGKEILPEKYMIASQDEQMEAIWRLKNKLRERLVILGHHYQQDEIIQFADYTGDSLKLSKTASEQKDKDIIVFCGVHFMAETADILSGPEQKVILPDLSAGCSMAEMADTEDVEYDFDFIEDKLNQKILGITYINSSASIKALVGKNGGAVCTSSNASAIIKWGLNQGKKILFLPDQHLGRNTGYKLGIPLEEMPVWDYTKSDGGLSFDDLRNAKLILWKGHCSVHQLFRDTHVDYVREKYPDINVIVHPECRFEVAQKSDYVGSTEFIIKTVTSAPAGTKWAVGTEANLVNRLAKNNPDKLVILLSGFSCLCSTMFRIDLPHLWWALENIYNGNLINQIKVPADIANYAIKALNKMLEIV